MESQNSQNEQILRYMQSGRKITPMEALNDFGCMRLGGRIFELKEAGYKIQDEWLKLPSGKRVKRYFLAT